MRLHDVFVRIRKKPVLCSVRFFLRVDSPVWYEGRVLRVFLLGDLSGFSVLRQRSMTQDSKGLKRVALV